MLVHSRLFTERDMKSVNFWLFFRTCQTGAWAHAPFEYAIAKLSDQVSIRNQVAPTKLLNTEALLTDLIQTTQILYTVSKTHHHWLATTSTYINRF